MGTNSQSINSMIRSAQQNGIYNPFYNDNMTATTAATTTSGVISCQRFPRSLTVPSLGAGLTGFVFPKMDFSNDDVCSIFAILEYNLGTLTVSGNSFADGVAMPSKTIRGTSYTTATEICFLVVTTAVTGTTPVMTITYTDQDGNTGNTCTLTLPTSPSLNTTFLMHPHLASGDTGIRDVTNMSISTGSSGVMRAYGGLIIGEGASSSGSGTLSLEMLSISKPLWPAVASDVIAFYRVGVTTSGNLCAMPYGVPDN